jgi:Cu2+-exporting ATPase
VNVVAQELSGVRTRVSAFDWSIYDRPEADRVYVRHEGEQRAIQLMVEGIRCGGCAGSIERNMRSVPGVHAVQVTVATGRVELAWTAGQVRLSELLERLAKIGYVPHPLGSVAAHDAGVRERRTALKRLLVAGVGMAQVMMFAFALYAQADYEMDPAISGLLRWISLATLAPVVGYSGWPFFLSAWRNLQERRLGMDVPVSLAILLAFGASLWNTWRGTGTVYYDSVAMFIFFLSIARFVEMGARHQAATVSEALALLVPAEATRIRNGRTERVAVAALRPGDRVLVAKGAAVPADGRVALGSTQFDESLLTGEGAPVARAVGGNVIAGTVNLDRPVEVVIGAIGADTVLAGIVRLLEHARGTRPRIALAADRAARWFVAGILAAAIVIAGVWLVVDPSRAFAVTLAMLVVTCPCALALATPAAIAASIGTLGRFGLLVTRPDAIEALAGAQRIVFDKTGTLTAGPSRVAITALCGNASAERCLALAAALERGSRHPLAAAFRSFEDPAVVATELREVEGAGVQGVIDGDLYRLGRLDFVLATAPADDPAHGAKARAWLAASNQLLASFDTDDQLRAGSREVFDELRALGLEIEIASGDSAERVEEIARALGVEHYASRLTPADKLAHIRSIQRQSPGVIMVGDGVNDAPVLAAAGVSIALQSGTALAQSSADLILFGASLEALPRAIAVARRSHRVIRQNLIWAAIYNAVAIPFAALGWIAPWLAALGMSLSSIVVVLNARRITRLARRLPAAPAAAPQRAEALA